MLRRKLRMLLAAPIMFLLMAVAPAPADATGYGVHCYWVWVYENGFYVQKLHCEDILVEIDYLAGGCDICGPAFRWTHEPLINPELESRFAERISTGLRLIGQATHTADTTSAARLWTDALNAFTTAATSSGRSSVRLGAAGVANPTTGGFTARPDLAWIGASGGDVLDGIAELKRALYPGPVGGSRATAMRQFEEAYWELSRQRVIAG
jgi:hypothetical protein